MPISARWLSAGIALERWIARLVGPRPGAGDHGSAPPDRDVACHLPSGFDNAGGPLILGSVKAVASVLLADPRSFVGYYRWDVYYPTSAGVLLMPRGFSERRRTSAAAYARAHPRRVLR